MKIRIDKRNDGFTVHIDRPPLPEDRFKAVCAVSAAGIYAGMVIGVAALCGPEGLFFAAVLTIVLAVIVGGLLI